MNVIGLTADNPAHRSLMSEAAGLRYRVFVEEMGREEPTADHGCRELLDDLDDHVGSTTFCAMVGDTLVGTVRATLSLTPAYRALYRLSEAPAERVSLCTRMAIAPSWRRSRVAYGLCQACFDLGARHGVLLNFIDANPPIDGLYRKLGFLPLGRATDHPRYGVVQPLVLILADTELLRGLHSPFYEVSANRYRPADAEAAVQLLRQLGHELPCPAAPDAPPAANTADAGFAASRLEPACTRHPACRAGQSPGGRSNSIVRASPTEIEKSPRATARDEPAD